MTTTVKSKKSDAIWNSFCALKVLLFLACFNASVVPYIQAIGDIAIYLSIILTVLTILCCSQKVVLTKYHIILTVYAVICMFVGLVTSLSLSMIFQILLIAWISIYSNHLGRNIILKGVIEILSALLLFCFIDVIIFRINGSALLFGNPNRIGIIGFLYVTVETLCRAKAKKLPTICGLVLILLSGARAPLLILLIGLALYPILKKIKSISAAKILFLLLLFGSVLFVYFYIHAQEYGYMIALNDFIYNLTGKNLFSGRQILWKEIFKNYNYDNIFFGYGLNFDVSNLTGQNLSSHNQFIQLIVQQGICGLILWVSVLFAIFMKAFKNCNKKACLFILMIIIYNLFEVFLLQNHFALGLIVWLVFFASDGVCGQKKKKEVILQTITAKSADSTITNYSQNLPIKAKEEI